MGYDLIAYIIYNLKYIIYNVDRYIDIYRYI